MWGVIWPFLAAGAVLTVVVIFWLLFEDDGSRRQRGRTGAPTYVQANRARWQINDLFQAAADEMVRLKLRRAGIRR